MKSTTQFALRESDKRMLTLATQTFNCLTLIYQAIKCLSC